MISPADEGFLRRALRLAMNGRGRVEPNPMVGCVLVRDGRVIGQGWHTHFGGPHAEPTALADCAARGETPAGATAYVTLEPCCHLNKKTPPCAPRLIEAKIARVVIGCLDPNPDVNGNGVAMLERCGVSVDVASTPLANEFLQLIAPFRAKSFYTTLKWAESANGHVAGSNGVPVRITCPAANLAVHRLRTRSEAIAVGINTVLADDPSLTVRDVEVIRTPLRIVLDRRLRIPINAKLLTSASKWKVGQDLYVLADPAAIASDRQKAAAIWNAGGEVIGVKNFAENLNAFRQSPALDRINTHLLIEPGPTLAVTTLPWAERLWVFISPVRVNGGPSAPNAAKVPTHYVETGRLKIGPDTLIEYLNRDASSFAAATPSADFVLERERADAESAGRGVNGN